jgi:hypothetical protein
VNVSPVKFSRAESVIIHMFLDAPREPKNIEQIAKEVYEGLGMERPANWQRSIQARMRTIELKLLAAGRVPIIRTSPIGRGHAAIYELN